MKNIEITKLASISGGCTTCQTHQDKAEHALYIQEMRPEVMKEAGLSALAFGGIAATIAAACGAAPLLIAGAGISTGIYVAQHVYNNSEIWL